MKTADFFAGLGGNRIGFERAGFVCVYAADIYTASVKTYNANFMTAQAVQKSIRQHLVGRPGVPDDIPDHDVFMGGFPCQPFSLAGKMEAFADEKGRGDLIYEIFRVISNKRPAVLFLENVKNLKTIGKGKYFAEILGLLNAAGYDVFYAVLNGMDYGVAQHRERLIIVGFRKDFGVKNFEFPPPLPADSPLRQKLSDIRVRPQDVELNYFLSTKALVGLRAHAARHAAKGHGFGLRVLGWDDVSGALTLGGMGRERNLVVDYEAYERHRGEPGFETRNDEAIRYLTPREFARLQGFPDSFVIDTPKTTAWRQFADSVPIPMVEAVARNIREALERAGAWKE